MSKIAYGRDAFDTMGNCKGYCNEGLDFDQGKDKNDLVEIIKKGVAYCSMGSPRITQQPLHVSKWGDQQRRH